MILVVTSHLRDSTMKLQFKHQPFQAEAAAAVCDIFSGQPMRTTTYRLDLGDMTNVQTDLDMTDTGSGTTLWCRS